MVKIDVITTSGKFASWKNINHFEVSNTGAGGAKVLAFTIENDDAPYMILFDEILDLKIVNLGAIKGC